MFPKVDEDKMFLEVGKEINPWPAEESKGTTTSVALRHTAISN